MKLRYLGSLLSMLALAAVVPACGDDSSSSDDDSSDDTAEAGADDEETSDDNTSTADDDGTDTDTDDDESTEDDDNTAETDDTEDVTDEDSDDTAETDDSEPSDGGTGEPTEEDSGTGEPTEEDSGTGEPTEEDSGTGEPTEEDSGGPIDECVPPEPEADPEPVDCPPVDEREVVEVGGDIDEDTTWSCDNAYYLSDYTYIVGDSTLTIEPGTIVYGDDGTALVITRGSQIQAVGQKDAPIVFTSSRAEGEREPGAWGGVHLLGAAPINAEGGEAQVEGLSPDEGRGIFGGDDWEHNCGTLKYVRVEFAGFEFEIEKELNSIGVAGCGSQTTFDYVQAHYGSDDGIEFWGGAAQAKHVLVSGAQDDSIDWDFGFQGNIQYLAIIQDTTNADNGFESDNNEDDNAAEPRSFPTIYNATVVGGPNYGLVLRRGTYGILRNSILTNFGKAAVDVRDAETVGGTETDPVSLSIDHSIFFNAGFEDESLEADDDDDGFDEEAYFTAAALNNQIEVDPDLGDIEDLTAPDLVPAEGSPAAEGAAAVPEGSTFFECSANYIGAFEPGAEAWTEGWTAFPVD